MGSIIYTERISRCIEEKYVEVGEVEFGLVGECLLELKKEFGGGDEELVKVVELKRIEQEGKIMLQTSFSLYLYNQ